MTAPSRARRLVLLAALVVGVAGALAIYPLEHLRAGARPRAGAGTATVSFRPHTAAQVLRRTRTITALFRLPVLDPYARADRGN